MKPACQSARNNQTQISRYQAKLQIDPRIARDGMPCHPAPHESTSLTQLCVHHETQRVATKQLNKAKIRCTAEASSRTTLTRPFSVSMQSELPLESLGEIFHISKGARTLPVVSCFSKLHPGHVLSSLHEERRSIGCGLLISIWGLGFRD